ncbi:l-ascorbate oxidase-like protein [Hordeum vulgare]|nr:l-ascorbate oxidase-like protein [Hordeum vulgare]
MRWSCGSLAHACRGGALPGLGEDDCAFAPGRYQGFLARLALLESAVGIEVGDAPNARSQVRGTRLCGPPHGRLYLPRPFAKVMEVENPQRVWLQVHGCRNGAVYANAEYPSPRVMILRRGWKTFARAHNFMAGHVLRFQLVDAYMLSVKIYVHSGVRLGCCEESLSDAESSSSSDNDEEDSVDGDGDSESSAVKSEHDGSGST